MTDRDQTEAVLGRFLDGDFLVAPMGEGQAQRSEVEAIGARFGVKYPAAFISHVCGRFPGIYVEVKEAVWPRPKQYEVGPFWSMLYGLHTFSPLAMSRDWMRLDTAAAEFQQRTQLVAAPILKVVGDADLFCADAGGRICTWNHETGELESEGADFWDLFAFQVSALRDRKNRKRQGQ